MLAQRPGEQFDFLHGFVDRCRGLGGEWCRGLQTLPFRSGFEDGVCCLQTTVMSWRDRSDERC